MKILIVLTLLSSPVDATPTTPSSQEIRIPLDHECPAPQQSTQPEITEASIAANEFIQAFNQADGAKRVAFLEILPIEVFAGWLTGPECVELLTGLYAERQSYDSTNANGFPLVQRFYQAAQNVDDLGKIIMHIKSFYTQLGRAVLDRYSALDA